MSFVLPFPPSIWGDTHVRKMDTAMREMLPALVGQIPGNCCTPHPGMFLL